MLPDVYKMGTFWVVSSSCPEQIKASHRYQAAWFRPLCIPVSDQHPNFLPYPAHSLSDALFSDFSGWSPPQWLTVRSVLKNILLSWIHCILKITGNHSRRSVLPIHHPDNGFGTVECSEPSRPFQYPGFAPLPPSAGCCQWFRCWAFHQGWNRPAHHIFVLAAGRHTP